MKTIKDYIDNISLHQKENRSWSHIGHDELIRWQEELWELGERISKLESERNRLIHNVTVLKKYLDFFVVNNLPSKK